MDNSGGLSERFLTLFLTKKRFNARILKYEIFLYKSIYVVYHYFTRFLVDFLFQITFIDNVFKRNGFVIENGRNST